jgi:hypothetical protein
MTVLIGASVLLIAASAIALVFGWAAANESLIWTSIVASAGAAVTLALAFFRSRVEAAAVARRSAREGATEPTVAATEPVAAAEPAAEPSPTAATEIAPEPVRRAAKPRSAAPPTRAAPDNTEVFGSRDSKRYHRPECRYAASKRAEKMTRSEADALGYRACGICKP